MKTELTIILIILVCILPATGNLDPECPQTHNCNVGFLEISQAFMGCWLAEPGDPNDCLEKLNSISHTWLQDCYRRAPYGECVTCWNEGMTPQRMQVRFEGIQKCMFDCGINAPNGETFNLYQIGDEGEPCLWRNRSTGEGYDYGWHVSLAANQYGTWVALYIVFDWPGKGKTALYVFRGDTRTLCAPIVNATWVNCNIIGIGGGWGGRAVITGCNYH